MCRLMCVKVLALQMAVVLTGEVVQGVECPAIRTEDGRVVALSSLPGPFQLGDRVRVTGSGYAGSAACQQEVLLVERAEAMDE